MRTTSRNLFRPGRALVSLVLIATAILLVGAMPAIAADYAYWYALPTQKIMKTSLPPSPLRRASTLPTAPALSLSAAKGEFEGRQIAVRPISTVNGITITASDLTQTVTTGTPAVIPAGEASVHWVHYVRLTVRSYGQNVRVPGYFPDPLPPTKLLDGSILPINAGVGNTRAFYILFHVPPSTPKGTYTGTLIVASSNAPTVTVPVRLRVWGFSIDTRTLRTSFGFSVRAAKYFSGPNHYWPSPRTNPELESTTFGGDTLNRWLNFMNDHRIAPQGLMPGLSTPSSAGRMTIRQEYVDDYVKTGNATTFSGARFGLNTLPMPDRNLLPSYVRNPFTSSAAKVKATNYYRSIRAAYGVNSTKAVVYPIDEPKEYQRALVQYYGALIHRLVPGAKFLVTIHPSDFRWVPLRNVDIYVHKLHFFYRDYRRWVLPLRRARKQVWLYSHTTTAQSVAPMYLIDKPFTDSRAQGWFAYHGMSPGLLYFNINRWYPPWDSTVYRDPYKSPLSIALRDGSFRVYGNGDGSLVYPGYYPAIGLDVPGAGPVSSLRMEALRDGLEDYEYLRRLQSKKSRAYAMAYVAKIISKTRVSRHNFPVYSKSPWAMQHTRDNIARIVESLSP